MRLTRLTLRDFRSYPGAQLRLGPGVTVVVGPNGAGKTNLLEAIHVACAGRSLRPAGDRAAIRFGQRLARVELEWEAEDGAHLVTVVLAGGEGRAMKVDGQAPEGPAAPQRPLVNTFLPDRLELVKGGPGLRRAHLDSVVGALWPARAQSRRAFTRALTQRNALIGRIRRGEAAATSLTAWDHQLARSAMALMADRCRAAEQLSPGFTDAAAALGLDGDPAIAYRPRSRAGTEAGLVAELEERVASDVQRGFTEHGPHRDELTIKRCGRELRTYGSQGQQRLAVLALLLAGRAAVGAVRPAPPILLLDDAMSELDAERRGRLIELLTSTGGQSVITTTDLDHVPGARAAGVTRIAVRDGTLVEAAEGRVAA